MVSFTSTALGLAVITSVTRRQILRPYNSLPVQDGKSLEKIRQLAHVARPSVPHQALRGLLGQTWPSLPGWALTAHQMLDQMDAIAAQTLAITFAMFEMSERIDAGVGNVG